MQRLRDLLRRDTSLGSRAALHTYVARLRRILRPHGVALDTKGRVMRSTSILSMSMSTVSPRR